MEAGLLVAGDDIPVPYDRFRDRVMFPITDARGRVIAFGGRALEKDVPAKYLNSPETPLFHKGDNLYNLATARQAAHNAGKSAQGNSASVVVVEGYVDVIAMLTATMSVHSPRPAPLSACQAMAESRPASISVTPRFGLRQKKRLSFSTKCRS